MAHKNTSKLAFLHPAFRPAVELLLAQAAEERIDVTITSGFRSIEEQKRVCAELKQRGLRDGRHYPCATPGLSAHQYGLAVDLVGGASLSSAEHRRLRQIGASIGFAFVAEDPPHFEHPGWRGVYPEVRRYILG